MDRHYSITIQWSKKDGCFVASLPEWGDYKVEGESYETVLANAQQTIALLVKSRSDKGQPLPSPQVFKTPSVA